MHLINHGIRSSLVEKVKLEMEDFFNLPMTEKKKFWQTPEHMEGFGQAFVLSEDQKLDWCDIFYMIALPKHSRMPHLFSQLPLPFRSLLRKDEGCSYGYSWAFGKSIGDRRSGNKGII
ncbi:hypothetical protein V8G54_026749 [Vigna mungo]|uniref:Non-haem dioxygenase N-terminal domain-containing protein n=1 Tax=Vigna mungo TaxID=3915 RepID=A0AAQ3N1D6_VIGMU